MRGFLNKQLPLTDANRALPATCMKFVLPVGTPVVMFRDRDVKGVRIDTELLRGSILIWNEDRRRWDANVFGRRLYAMITDIASLISVNRISQYDLN